MSNTSIRDFGTKEWIAFDTEDTILYRDLDSINYVKHKYFAVKVMKVKEKPPERPLIPATLTDQIAFLCFFMWSPLKRQIFDVSYFYSDLYWQTSIMYIIFKTIPCAIMVYFLSVYSPLEHMYISKMTPIFHGTSWQVILCGFFKVAYFSDILVTILDFTITGIVNNVPWNRCAHDYYNITNRTVHCYHLYDFYKVSRNANTTLDDGVFNLNGTYFQLSQLLYIMLRNDLQAGCFNLSFSDFYYLYYGVIWIMAVFFHSQMFKQFIWKVFKCLMCILCFIYFVTYVYIEISLMEESFVRTSRPPLIEEDGADILRKSSMIGMVESTTAPPILHMLNSRKSTKVKWRRDSLIFSLFVLLFFILQNLTYINLKNFCYVKAGTDVQLNVLNSYPFYVYWPMFFRNFALGPFYNKVVYTTMLSLEFITFVITYQCLVEVFTCEWRMIERIYASLILTAVGLIYIHFTSAETRFLLNLSGQWNATIIEIIALIWFYPYGRLMEDMLFFSRLHVKKLCVLFMIFLINDSSMVMASETYNVITVYNYIHAVSTMHIILILFIPSSPIIVGALYKICSSVVFTKEAKWRALFTPLPSWGPTNYVIRQYRKHFDSRKFIHSLGSRYLCRHMLKTIQPHKYRIDVEYERDK